MTKPTTRTTARRGLPPALIRRADWVRDAKGRAEYFFPGMTREAEDAALGLLHQWALSHPERMGAWIAKIEAANRMHKCPCPACSGKRPAA